MHTRREVALTGHVPGRHGRGENRYERKKRRAGDGYSTGEIAVLCRVVPVVQHGEQIPLA
jgi:hypothetical protein